MTKIDTDKPIYSHETYTSLKEAVSKSNDWYLKGYQVMSILPMLNGEIESVYELRNKNPRAKAVGPDVPEELVCRRYFVGKGFMPEESKRFLEYWGRSNWHDRDGHPVKNWKGRAATWMGNIEKFQTTQTTADYTNL